jgi:hypothetical protein
MTKENRTALAAVVIVLVGALPAWPQKSKPTELILEQVDYTYLLAREPMVVEHPNGALFVGGYGGTQQNGPQPPKLWTSRDHGATWTRVNVGTAADGALGNSDVDLAVARDGTLYFANLIYEPQKREDNFVTVGVSRDAGETWSWQTLSKKRFDDRPWVKVAPDGTAHVIWNDGGVSYRASRDRGKTWSDTARISEHGGSSHLAVGPKGEVAVRITPASASGFNFDADVDLIAVSADAGKTWEKHRAPGDRELAPGFDQPLPRWVEPIAWDSSGALYSLWTNAKGLWLARSRDRGSTWKIWQLIESAEVAYFPYLVAGPRAGELAATWVSGKAEALKAHAALINVDRDDAAPRMLQSLPFAFDCWSNAGGKQPMTRTTGGEYLGITFLREGGFGVVSPIQNAETKRSGFSWRKAAIR